jgi:hypothetical protein
MRLETSIRSTPSSLSASYFINVSFSHRHVRYALFFHSLAMIASIRKGSISQDDQQRYLEQIDLNQAYIRK